MSQREIVVAPRAGLPYPRAKQATTNCAQTPDHETREESDLTTNATELKVIDGALSRMHIEYGDDADSRQDYLKLAPLEKEALANLRITSSAIPSRPRHAG
jgi:hypothetical protein